MKKILCIALVCVMAVAALAGCGGGSTTTEDGTDNSVVGKWTMVIPDEMKEIMGDSVQVWELKDDGTVTYYMDGKEVDTGSTALYTYTVDDDKLSFHDGDTVVQTLIIDGNELKDSSTGEVLFKK